MFSDVRFAVVFLIASIAVSNYKVFAQSSVAESFENNGIVPDVISLAPNCEVWVNYPSGVRVNLGNELTPTEVKDIPTVHYDAIPEKFYTLAFFDPDVPSRAEPTSGEWKHWLVTNIPGNDVSSGEILAEFVGSAPPCGTGLHRYIFLIYQQPNWLLFDEPRLNNTSAYNRSHFSIANFALKYNLGDPVGGNFYEAQYDDYVPILNAQLG